MRKSEYNRTTDFYRANTPLEKLYYSAGIPSMAWKKFSKKTLFQLMLYNNNQISPEEQGQWYDKFTTNASEFDKAYLVLIGSMEDDHKARLLSYELMKTALKDTNHRIQITNAEAVKEEIVRDETVFMLYNVFLDCTKDRVQDIRDWIIKHEDSFRVVAVGGDPSIFIKQCKIKPNVLLYINGIKIQTRV